MNTDDSTDDEVDYIHIVYLTAMSFLCMLVHFIKNVHKIFLKEFSFHLNPGQDDYATVQWSALHAFLNLLSLLIIAHTSVQPFSWYFNIWLAFCVR
jgi:hypothetical protein